MSWTSWLLWGFAATVLLTSLMAGRVAIEAMAHHGGAGR